MFTLLGRGVPRRHWLLCLGDPSELKLPITSGYPNSESVRYVPGPGVTTQYRQPMLTLARDRGLEVRVASRAREHRRPTAAPLGEEVVAFGVHLQLLVVVVVARAWHLHGAAHQVHVHALARVHVTRRDRVDLGSCRTLVLRHVAEAILVLCGSELIGAGAWVALGEVLEARVLDGLRAASVHNAGHLLNVGRVVVSAGPRDGSVGLGVLLDVNFLEVLPRETEGVRISLRRLHEHRV